MSVLDWVVIVIYFVVLILIGWQTIKRIEGMEDYAVAGRRVIWPVLFATLAASMIGGGASIGNAGNSYKDGYVFVFAFFAWSLQTAVVGWFIAPRMRKYHDAQTVGDVMEMHYGRIAKFMTGILSVVVCAGILGAQALAIGTVFHEITGLSVTWGIIVGMGAVIAYSTFGGMWAVIQTDVLQFVILGVIIPIVMVLVVHTAGGPAHIVNTLPHSHFTFLGSWSIPLYISTFLAWAFGETLVPPYSQRAFTTPNPTETKKGFLWAAGFSVLFLFMSATIGQAAAVLYPNIASDQAFPHVVTQFLPIGLKGLAVAALLAVIMSTASAFLNSTSVVFVRDIYQGFIEPNVSRRRTLVLAQILTLITGVAAVIFALTAPSIISALMYSYYFWAPTIVIPLVVAVVLKWRNKIAGLSAMFAGGLVMAIWTWILHEPYSVSGLAAGLVANVVIITLVGFATRGRYARLVLEAPTKTQTSASTSMPA